MNTSNKAQRAILMGHPNSMAYGAWERAEMRFQPPLKSYFVVPKIVQWSTTVRELMEISGLEKFIHLFEKQERERKGGR